MNEETKQKINKAVRDTFAVVGVDYDSRQPQIVPLFEIIGEYSLFVTELADDRNLTSQRAIAAIGQKTSNLPTDNDKLSGFLYASQFEDVLDGWIFTEKSEPTVRRRFSAAHELGHYLLHFLPQLSEQPENKHSVFIEGVSFDKNETDEKNNPAIIHVTQDLENARQIGGSRKFEMEFEANQFAAELLMPRNACLASAQTYAKKFGANKAVLVRRLATDFLVSFEAMLRRLKDLEFYEG